MTLQVDRATRAVTAREEAERVEAIATRGFTERQARFLVTVMLHSGVFVGRQYAAFAGISHGQKVHDFIEKLLVRRFVTAIRLGATGRRKIFHVHHKPLYGAIGEPDNRNRRPVMLDRAIERLIILDGVLADPSLTWLGSEHDKLHHFRQRLGDTLRDNEYPSLVFGKAPNQTIRYFPDKLPVGFERHGYRHVFLYPAKSSSPMDFRLFLLRHLELLNGLSHWTIRVLFPRSLASAMDTFQEAAYEHLTKHLQLSAAEELRWFFRQHQRTGQVARGADDARLRAARKEFRAPRFTALRRRWLEEGDRVIWLAASPVSRDADPATGERRVRQASAELRSFLIPWSHRRPATGPCEGDEARGRSGPPQ